MAYTWYQLEDGADSTLSAAITNTATTMTLADATGFPASGDFLVTIWDPVGHDEPADDANMEIVVCTSRTGNVLTITRGFGDTTGAAHNEDDRAGLYVNKAIIEEVTDFLDAGEYTALDVDVDPQYPPGTIFGSYETVGIRSVVAKTTGDGDINYSIAGVSGTASLDQLAGILGDIKGGSFLTTLTEGACTNQIGLRAYASATGGTIANDLIGIYGYAGCGASTISGDAIGAKIEISKSSGTVTGDVIGLLIDDTSADYAIKQEGTAKSSLTAIDVGGATNYAEIKSDGSTELHGTARVTRRIILPCTLGSTPPDTVVTDYSTGWSFDIGDDARAQACIPADFDASASVDISVVWYINEAYATGSGEVQWEVSTGDLAAGESVLAPTDTDTDTSGDINIPATANTIVETNVLTASCTAESILGVKLERIALTDGSSPTADPVVLGIVVEYTANKI